MKKTIIALGIFLASSSNIYALTLDEALSEAYKNNQNIKASQQVFLSDIERFPQALASFLPSVSANINVANTKQKSDSQYFPGAQSSRVGPDVSRTLNIQQNVFSGGQSVMGLKIAQAGFWVARSKLYSAEQDTLNKAIQAYLGVCEAREKYNIVNDSVEFYKQNLLMVDERLKVGEATVTDAALASAQLASAEAGKSNQYATLLAASANFKTIVGIDPTEDMEFPPLPEGLPETMEKFQEMALKSNLDILSSKYQLIQAKAGVKSASGALLPSADINIKAGKNFYDPEVRPTRLNSSSRQNAMSVTTSLSVNIPIFNKGGADYSSIRQSKKQTRQAVYGLEYVENQIRAQMVQVWEGFAASKDSIIFVNKAVEAQKLALEGLRQEYIVGSKTMLEVLKTQQDLNSAQSQAVDVKKNYILGAYNVKALMGQATANQLKLKGKYFNPEQEFKSIKHKVAGF